MADLATATPGGRKVEDRIGVLEELLSERFFCRAVLPHGVPRANIEHILASAQKNAY